MVIKKRRSDSVEAIWIDGAIGSQDGFYHMTSRRYINDKCSGPEEQKILNRRRPEIRKGTLESSYQLLFDDFFSLAIGDNNIDGAIDGFLLTPSFKKLDYRSLVTEIRANKYDLSRLKILNHGPQSFGYRSCMRHVPRKRVYRQVVLRYDNKIADLVNNAINKTMNYMNTVSTEARNHPEEIQVAYLGEIDYLLNKAVSIPILESKQQRDEFLESLEKTGYTVRSLFVSSNDLN